MYIIITHKNNKSTWNLQSSYNAYFQCNSNVWFWFDAPLNSIHRGSMIYFNKVKQLQTTNILPRSSGLRRSKTNQYQLAACAPQHRAPADSPWPCHPAGVQEGSGAHGSCSHEGDPTWATQVASQISPTFRDRGCRTRESKPNGAGDMGAVVDWRGATRTLCHDKPNVSTTWVHSTETSVRHSKSSEM